MANRGPVPRKVLLCVDDEVIGLKARKMLLERQGYRVLSAREGVEGLDLFNNNQVDAVVLDYFMPGMHGGIVASAMKRAKPQVPIILLSAYLSLPEAEVASVDAFLVKGGPPEALLRKIAELTSSAA